jgi:hypothetical protein
VKGRIAKASMAIHCFGEFRPSVLTRRRTVGNDLGDREDRRWVQGNRASGSNTDPLIASFD